MIDVSLTPYEARALLHAAAQAHLKPLAAPPPEVPLVSGWRKIEKALTDAQEEVD